jgi:hypothetical protein
MHHQVPQNVNLRIAHDFYNKQQLGYLFTQDSLPVFITETVFTARYELNL